MRLLIAVRAAPCAAYLNLAPVAGSDKTSAAASSNIAHVTASENIAHAGVYVALGPSAEAS